MSYSSLAPLTGPFPPLLEGLSASLSKSATSEIKSAPCTIVVGGSDLCRKSLWQWVFTRIEPKRSRLKNEIGQQLGGKLDAEKAAGRPVKLVRMKIAAMGTRLLFRELVKMTNN